MTGPLLTAENSAREVMQGGNFVPQAMAPAGFAGTLVVDPAEGCDWTCSVEMKRTPGLCRYPSRPVVGFLWRGTDKWISWIVPQRPRFLSMGWLPRR